MRCVNTEIGFSKGGIFAGDDDSLKRCQNVKKSPNYAQKSMIMQKKGDFNT